MIALPAVKHFAKSPFKERILQEVLDGKKYVCLAITEAFAGSDVAGTKTTAKKSQDGKFWIVRGEYNILCVRCSAHTARRHESKGAHFVSLIANCPV